MQTQSIYTGERSEKTIEQASTPLPSAQVLSRVRLFATPWTVARQALLSMGSSRQEYWSGLPGPPPGDFPDPGIEPESLTSPHWQAGFLPLVPPGKAFSDLL